MDEKQRTLWLALRQALIMAANAISQYLGIGGVYIKDEKNHTK